MLAIHQEEEDIIGQMAKELKTSSGDAVILSLNLLWYVLEQRKHGRHLTLQTGADKTNDILKEASGDEIKFTLNS